MASACCHPLLAKGAAVSGWQSDPLAFAPSLARSNDRAPTNQDCWLTTAKANDYLPTLSREPPENVP
jgi:hypothetical protein